MVPGLKISHFFLLHWQQCPKTFTIHNGLVLDSRLKMTMSHSRTLYSGPSDKVTSLNNKILQTDMNIDKSKIVHPQTYQVWELIHTSSIKCMSIIRAQIPVYFNYLLLPFVLTCSVFICIMHRYIQVKIVMACVELHNSNENIMEPVDWRFSYKFCSRFKSSWEWHSVVG